MDGVRIALTNCIGLDELTFEPTYRKLPENNQREKRSSVMELGQFAILAIPSDGQNGDDCQRLEADHHAQPKGGDFLEPLECGVITL